MDRPSAEAELSVTRSRVRYRVLLFVSSVGEAFAGQIARATGYDRRRVLWAMHGHPPKYKAELSLVALGLVRVRESSSGAVFEITSRGRRKARNLTSRLVRRNGRGRA